MTAQPCIVALEGPCCAGKTTLGRLLLQELCELAVTFVPCYADHAGGGRFLPRQEADTVAEREQALRQLLLIEAGRLGAGAARHAMSSWKTAACIPCSRIPTPFSA